MHDSEAVWQQYESKWLSTSQWLYTACSVDFTVLDGMHNARFETCLEVSSINVQNLQIMSAGERNRVRRVHTDAVTKLAESLSKKRIARATSSG